MMVNNWIGTAMCYVSMYLLISYRLMTLFYSTLCEGHGDRWKPCSVPPRRDLLAGARQVQASPFHGRGQGQRAAVERYWNGILSALRFRYSVLSVLSLQTTNLFDVLLAIWIFINWFNGHDNLTLNVQYMNIKIEFYYWALDGCQNFGGTIQDIQEFYASKNCVSTCFEPDGRVLFSRPTSTK
jgi:hypothetical protein